MGGRFFQSYLKFPFGRRLYPDLGRVFTSAIAEGGRTFDDVKVNGKLGPFLGIEDLNEGVAKMFGQDRITVGIPGVLAEIEGIDSLVWREFPAISGGRQRFQGEGMIGQQAFIEGGEDLYIRGCMSMMGIEGEIPVIQPDIKRFFLAIIADIALFCGHGKKQPEKYKKE